MYLLTLLALFSFDGDIYSQRNLVAWCVTPFDAKERSPAERAAMLKRLGFTRFAYDWRDKHLPALEEEIQQLIRNGIILHAVWFPPQLNADARHILSVLQRNKVVTQLWVNLPEPPGADDAAKVEAAVSQLKPLVSAAREIGCTVCLYKHGGWMGQAENQIAILRKLNEPGVGVIYNLHHGHSDLGRFAEVLKMLKPWLRCISLNGMIPDGDRQDRKVMPVGAGTEDLKLLRLIRDSGYGGPIAVMGHDHTVDVAERLQDNLDGLNWLKAQLDGGPAGPKPKYRSYK